MTRGGFRILLVFSVLIVVFAWLIVGALNTPSSVERKYLVGKTYDITDPLHPEFMFKITVEGTTPYYVQGTLIIIAPSYVQELQVQRAYYYNGNGVDECIFSLNYTKNNTLVHETWKKCLVLPDDTPIHIGNTILVEKQGQS